MREEDLIIDLPHLQTLGQRLGSLVVLLSCWALWIYFLIPLVSLSGWLMGVRKFSAEVRWFGGYKSLIELLQLYGFSVLCILLLWLLWTAFKKLTGHAMHAPPPATTPAGPDSFATRPVVVEQARDWQCVTVTFNDHGQMTATSELRE